MTILDFVYQHGIAISVPVFAFGVILLVLCITGVVKTVRKARLFSIPLLDMQEISFTDPGRVVLSMEGPQLTSRFANLDFVLLGPDGLMAKSRPALFRFRTSGVKQTRTELKIYEIVRPGRHIFQISGLDGDQPSDTRYRMVFTRPHLKTSIPYILGIVMAGNSIIWSIVLFFMRCLSVNETF
jgi:hypothetical protein